jgi:hypothetical protein
MKTFVHIAARNSISALKEMNHSQKAEIFQEVLDEAILYKEEVERLLNIFKKLDQMYQPHNKDIPNHKGLLDSPISLQMNTRAAINAALNLEG